MLKKQFVCILHDVFIIILCFSYSRTHFALHAHIYIKGKMPL